MRRFSAFLMIAALVAVLVPSAALAAPPAKPVDAITSITWTSLGPGADPGSCGSSVTFQYTVAKGSPRYYRVAIWQTLGAISNIRSWKVEADGNMTVDFPNITYWDVGTGLENGAPAYVEVELLNRKLTQVLATASTAADAYIFPEDGTCPDSGSPIPPPVS